MLHVVVRYVRISRFVVLILLAHLSHFLFSQETLPSRPNVIFILADDLGWRDLGAYGSGYYETPNIDRLAAQGMKFTNYHSAQNCAPARAALMSGQYAPRTGIYMVGSVAEKGGDLQDRPLKPIENTRDLGLDKITIAQALKNNGYVTAMFGKWHLGNYEKNPAYHPSRRGFDEAIETSGKHFKFQLSPETNHDPNAYLADWLTDKSIDFIRRNKEKPFFLYLPHFAPHSPFQAKKELEQRFAAKPPVEGHSNPTYAAMIYSLDESVGRIMALLEELKLDKNTVLIFSSDNGGVGGYDKPGGLIRKDSDDSVDNAPIKNKNEDLITDNSPLRSGKGSFYEGGTRVPFIVRWPGKIKEGSVSDVPAIHVDLYPTLLDATQSVKPESYTLDGKSLVPIFINAEEPKREGIFQHFPAYLGAGTGQWRATPVSTVISGDWKLMEFLENNRVELYHLREDIGEKNNLAEKNIEKRNELLRRLHQWREEIKAPMPTPNTVTGTPSTPRTKKEKKMKGSVVDSSLNEDRE